MAECAAAAPLRRWAATTTTTLADALAATSTDRCVSGSSFVRSSDSGDALCDDAQDAAAKTKKKHSGPRKRRPKKKGEDAALPDAVHDHSRKQAQVAPVVAVATTDAASIAEDAEIEALLQKELVMELDGDNRAAVERSPQRTSPNRTAAPSPVTAAAGRPHKQQQQQPRQPSQATASTSRAARAMPSRPNDHSRYRHRHAAASGTYSASDLYCQRPAPPAPQPPQQVSELSGELDDRSYWTKWVIEAAEKERARRLNVLKQLQQEEEEEIQRRRKWAIEAIEREQEAMMREMFLDNMKNTQWFQSTISRLAEDYEVVCPNSWFGCMFSCMLKDLEVHLESCVYRQVPDTLDQAGEDSLGVDFYSYDVVCPNAVLGCNEICSRENLAAHLASCPVNGISREKEWEERLEGRRNVLLATEEERARRVSEQQMQSKSEEDGEEEGEDSRFSFGHLQQLYEEQTAMMQVVLHDEIVDFCEQQEHEALELRPWIHQAVAKVKRAIQELWGSHTTQVEGYGSFATQLHNGYSDVDLVVFGVAEEESLTCQQCVSALAAHFAASQSRDFVEISAITRASVPLLKAVVLVNVTPEPLLSPSATAESSGRGNGGERVLRVPFDITFDDPRGFSHNGIASAALISTLSDHFYGLRELAFVLKYFLVKRGLNDPYVGGLSSYGLLLMIIFILQEQGALTSVNQTASNARYEAQRQKGEQVAQEIISQSLARQLRKLDGTPNSGSNITSSASATRRRRKARRLHLPSLLADVDDNGEHEAKPFLLGKYLMDFLQFYGNDFRQHVDTIMVSGLDASEIESIVAAAASPGSGRSSLASPSPPTSSPRVLILASPPGSRSSPSPPPSIACPLPLPPSSSAFPSPSMSPLSPSPLSQEGLLMIRDPLQPENNVGKSCYRVSQVCKDFSDFLSFLTALIVRGSVMTTGKKKSKKKPLQPQEQQVLNPDRADADIATPPSPPTSNTGSTSPTNEDPGAPPLPPRHQHQHHVRNTSHRILTSVFEMKTRDTRASLDLTNN